ncbi:MAG: hypothetical protein RLZZ186_1093 [Cyanobacteriota bacterium]|jgi:hypothetical protein
MIDWLQAQDHLFLSGITPEEPVILALFPKERGTCIHVHTTGDLPEEARSAVQAAMDHNPDLSLGFLLNPGGTKNDEIKFCRALFYEDDGPAPLEEKLSQWEHCGLPRPSMQLWTGGKSVHNYWFLREPCSTAAFTAGQKLLFKHVESCLTGVKVDTSLSKPCQVLRLAGGVHPKTGEQSKVMSTTGELFELQQLMALVRPAETQAAAEVADEDLPHAKKGRHYERMTALEKRQVVQEALRFCPEREAAGSGTYEVARDVLAAMVHEFGPDIAVEISRGANWSQQHWDIKKVAMSLVDAPENRKTIWHLFKEAQRKGWICPWPLEREVRNKENENENDPLIKELRQRSYWQWAEARAAAFTLSSVFPQKLADLLGDRARAFPVSDMALLAPFMTTLASVLGKRYWVQVATGWKEPCIFWMGTVAPAGSKKTPVANQFLWPLEHRDSEGQAEYKVKMKEWRSGPGDTAPPNFPRQRVVMDATLEALCSLLNRDDIPGVVSFHDELASFIGSMDKYRRNASDRAAWLSMWSGGGINILRKGSEPILISKTAVSLFGAIQQDKLTDLLHGDDAAAKSGDGFWSRFLWVSPPYVKPRVMRDGLEINQELLELVDLLDSMSPQQVEVVKLSDGAWEVFEETANRFTEEAENTYASRSAFLMKMHGYLARSAGLLWALDHVCNGNEMRTIGDKGPITREVMERAAVLCQFFLNQFDVLAPQVGGGDLPGWVVKVIELAKTRETKKVTARDLVTRRWCESGAEAKEKLQKLVSDYGLGRLLKTPRADQVWWELPDAVYGDC